MQFTQWNSMVVRVTGRHATITLDDQVQFFNKQICYVLSIFCLPFHLICKLYNCEDKASIFMLDHSYKTNILNEMTYKIWI